LHIVKLDAKTDDSGTNETAAGGKFEDRNPGRLFVMMGGLITEVQQRAWGRRNPPNAVGSRVQ
jgi:hypothetical protein